jgi:hypothetical protein
VGRYRSTEPCGGKTSRVQDNPFLLARGRRSFGPALGRRYVGSGQARTTTAVVEPPVVTRAFVTLGAVHLRLSGLLETSSRIGVRPDSI